MKRKLRMFLPLVCAAILLMGMTVLASGWDDTRYCDNCGAALLRGAREAGHWQETHHTYNSEGKPIDCTITHVMTELEKYCPNGHGVKASMTQHNEYHSNTECPYNNR